MAAPSLLNGVLGMMAKTIVMAVVTRLTQIRCSTLNLRSDESAPTTRTNVQAQAHPTALAGQLGRFVENTS